MSWHKGRRPGRMLSWRLPREVLEEVGGGAQVAVVTLTAPIVRRSYNRWGATSAEIAGVMPGDELVPLPKMTSTRAISIGAAPDVVWAWLVQIGQSRGGFYSFDALENMLRCDIHSAGRIIPQLQELHAGDLIQLAPAGAPCYRVATVEPPWALVLVAADPKTRAAGPIPAGPEEMGMTWQWMLRPVDEGRRTRLLARQRYSYPRRQSVLWHLVEPVDFVMERRMLTGIKARAEARHPAAHST